MAHITEKEELAPEIKRLVLSAPEVAKKIKPGQFIILRCGEKGERFPLTVVEQDEEKGTLTIIFQEVGSSTKRLGSLEDGEEVTDIVGPLGNPSEVKNFGTVVCIGGGVGTAVVYPVAKALKAAGNRLVSIIGAKNKQLVILEEQMREISDRLLVTTDDGSYGMHGFVTDALEKLIADGLNIDRVVAVGPVVMMSAVCFITKKVGIQTVVSLNPIMVDGTGMCGACRVTVAGQTRFACIDGPEFDGHQVDFEELLRRQRMYLEEEKIALQIENQDK
ncbi:MAG: sulfide/dihydroorotate dehydrogenase-like FAD/NAD-binding protein [Candidatus Latescibacterota bacterium]|nr:MAG: sulfide/dihydroorotate dehydrogenase-like FAD/NAD-binding protein [Candidatus Latescibacterota bacterium]